MTSLSTSTLNRIARLVGRTVRPVRAVSGGYTPAARWIVEDATGRRVFAKVGTTADTAGWIRDEASVYERIDSPRLPVRVAFDDDPEHPLLLLEDLSAARWPPPWDDALVDEVRAALDEIHALRPDGVPTFAARHGELGYGWAEVARDPEPFLRLGLTAPDWLDDALPRLCAAERSVDTGGDALAHFDVRSDNLCRTERGVVLIDWNHACLSNPDLDTGFWLPSLAAEGGPSPERVLPDAPAVAAFVSGFFACRAGGPPIPEAPRVRAVQLFQLRPALAWVARAVGLP